MQMPLVKIGQLIKELTKLIAVVGPIAQDISSSRGQKKDLKEAVELQATVVKSLEEQLVIVKAVLSNIEKSLRIWAWTTVSIGVLSLVSLVVAIIK